MVGQAGDAILFFISGCRLPLQVTVVTWGSIINGYVVGLGSFCMLTPSTKYKPIGYVNKSGRIRSKTCRFTHGAGWKRFFRGSDALLSREVRYSKPTGVDARI